jgi:hypothetical protein
VSSSARDAVVLALEGWLRDDARERVARLRGDADADPPEPVDERHSLRGPRMRELFEEARERGLLSGDELSLAMYWLREAHLSPGRTRAEQRSREALSARVPHDSDHHPPLSLFLRMITEAHEGRRRAIARSLEDFARRWLAALREGLADVEESAASASWLSHEGPDRTDETQLVAACLDLLRDTHDAWSEIADRVAHASSVSIESWSDLLLVLRGSHGPARDRFSRLASLLGPLGVVTVLGKRARVHAPAPSARLRSSVIAIEPPRDVRIVPTSNELGPASERDALIAIGRATAIAWTHPSLSPLAARPLSGTVGRALGALFAHLLGAPSFVKLAPREARELWLALELFELRTHAAIVLAQQALDRSDFADAAREELRGAWAVDVSPCVAGCVCVPRSSEPLADVRALRWAAPFFLALRDRYDDDFWRNPRAAEPLRAACERGSTLSVEAWAEELGADPARLADRVSELLA